MSKDTKDPHAPQPTREAAPASTPASRSSAFFFCFLAGVAVMWGYDQQRMQERRDHGRQRIVERRAGDWDDSESPVPISSKDPMWGKRDAPVTIVQFSDFQCPYCSRVEPTLDQVKTTYGPDKVRIVWKNNPLPFHPNAKPAAEAAAGRVRAGRQRRVLEVPRHRVQEPGRARRPTATRSGRPTRA